MTTFCYTHLILITLSLLLSQTKSLSLSPLTNGHQKSSRRDALSSLTVPLLSSVAAAGASSIFIEGAQATTIPPPPVSVAGKDSVYIPGLAGGARLQNVIVEEANSVEPWKPRPSLVTSLGKSRILATELSPLSPPLTPFSSDNELYYDPFLFGAWKATATLKRKIFPYGTNYLPSSSLLDGSPRNRGEQPGDTTIYEIHYFSPNTAADGGNIFNGKSKVIAEREFNTRSINLAYQQLSQVKDVKWDYKKDPTRLTIEFSTLADDMQPLGEKRAEIYFNARKTETGVDAETNENVFCASERSRSVVLMPGNVVVSDTETITEFRLVKGSDGNHVKATSRIAVYLTPNPNSREGILWQDVNGKAVAFYDYEIDMRRLIKVDDKGGETICVYTPYGARQCLS